MVVACLNVWSHVGLGRRTHLGSLARGFARWAAGFGNGDDGRLGHGPGVGSILKPARILLHSAMASGEINETDEVIAVSAGGAHSALLTREGAILSAGLNDLGQLGRPKAESVRENESNLLPVEILQASSQSCDTMRRIELPGRAVDVTCGHHHTLVLLESGEVIAFGSNKHGQLGVRATTDSSINMKPTKIETVKEFVSISAGAAHSVGVSSDGTLYSWGCNRDNRLGVQDSRSTSNLMTWLSTIMQEASVPLPTAVHALRGLKITAAAAGDMHTIVIDVDGKCFTFGGGRFGQLGAHTHESKKPILLDFDHPIKQVAAGSLHSAAITTFGSLYMWGGNESGCLGLKGNTPGQITTEPVKLEKVQDVKSVSCGWKHSAAVSADGSLYTWGWGGSVGSMQSGRDDGSGQLGHGNEFDKWEPQKVESVLTVGGRSSQIKTHAVSCGFNHTLAVMENYSS